MGLSDIIRKVHGSETLSTLLDQYLLGLEKTNPPREWGWHPSGFIGMCARQAVLEKLVGVPEGDGFGAGLLRIFDVGTALHAWYQNHYYGPMGILWGKWACLSCGEVVWGTRPLPIEVCCKCESKDRWDYREVPLKAFLGEGIKKPIVGHSDGIIKIQGLWYLLEIKTINMDGFTWQKKIAPKHALQAQVYAELVRQGKVRGCPVDVPKISGIIVIYVNKNNSVEREYRLDFDVEVARAEIKKPYLVETSFLNKEFPPRCKDCVNMLQKPAKQCPMVTYCFGGKSWNQLAR